MTQEEIKKILPHRDKMLLVDEAEICTDSLDEQGNPTKCTGSYTITGEEWFLQGHFPGNPVVPGVVLCEIMAQTCCVLLAEKAKGEQITPYFTSLDKVKFRGKVRPQDRMEIECELVKVREPFYFAKGKGSVGGKLCVSAEFSFACMREASASARF